MKADTNVRVKWHLNGGATAPKFDRLDNGLLVIIPGKKRLVGGHSSYWGHKQKWSIETAISLASKPGRDHQAILTNRKLVDDKNARLYERGKAILQYISFISFCIDGLDKERVMFQIDANKHLLARQTAEKSLSNMEREFDDNCAKLRDERDRDRTVRPLWDRNTWICDYGIPALQDVIKSEHTQYKRLSEELDMYRQTILNRRRFQDALAVDLMALNPRLPGETRFCSGHVSDAKHHPDNRFPGFHPWMRNFSE